MLQDGSSIIGNDNFTGTGLDLLSVQLPSLFQMTTKRTILSIPFGPRLVRTASETAGNQPLSTSTSKGRDAPLAAFMLDNLTSVGFP